MELPSARDVDRAIRSVKAVVNPGLLTRRIEALHLRVIGLI